jgi:hypothetical protein
MSIAKWNLNAWDDGSKWGPLESAEELISKPFKYGVRRLWIKRRDADGNYEDEWYRIDEINAESYVINWGVFTLEIDREIIANFQSSSNTIIVKNTRGEFNYEGDLRSLFYGFLNRRYTKIKIEAGYKSSTGNVSFINTIYEGYIDRVDISPDNTANITILSYYSIFTKYDISDLGLTGRLSFKSILGSILDQEKIRKILAIGAPVLAQDAYISDSTKLQGTYWDVINYIAFRSNSIPLLESSEFKFVSRTPSTDIKFNFKGRGTKETCSIYNILGYDDEGIDKIRVLWKDSDEDSTLEALTTNETLRKKYLEEPEYIDLSLIDTDKGKQDILDAALTEWQNPKPIITFTTYMFIDQLKLLDRITIKILGDFSPKIVPGGPGIKWGTGRKWDDGAVWGEYLGAININDSINWKIISLSFDLDNWETIITAEKIL